MYESKNYSAVFLTSSHAVTADVSLSETVKAAEFFLADGIILTGTATGDPANVAELAGMFLYQQLIFLKCFLLITLTKKIKNE